MTTHPEAAMTRERAVDEALREIWSRWFAFYKKHFRGKGIAISMADQQAFYEIAQPLIRALASAKQEPAPSADAEEIAKFAFKIACDWGNSQCSPVVADAIRKDRALRRYAGDGGVM